MINCLVMLEPTWAQTTGAISCWHWFFDRVMAVLNDPMKSRKAFQNDGNGGMSKLIAYTVAVY